MHSRCVVSKQSNSDNLLDHQLLLAWVLKTNSYMENLTDCFYFNRHIIIYTYLWSIMRCLKSMYVLHNNWLQQQSCHHLTFSSFTYELIQNLLFYCLTILLLTVFSVSLTTRNYAYPNLLLFPQTNISPFPFPFLSSIWGNHFYPQLLLGGLWILTCSHSYTVQQSNLRWTNNFSVFAKGILSVFSCLRHCNLQGYLSFSCVAARKDSDNVT